MLRIVSLVVVPTLAVLLLGGCAAPNQIEPVDVSSLACDQVAVEIDSTISRIEAATKRLEETRGTPGEVSAKEELAAAKSTFSALQQRASQCAEAGGGSVTVSSQPTYIGWDDVMRNPPEGLREALASTSTSFSWADVESWASSLRSPNGKAWDVRAVLVFDQDDTTPAKARAAAGVPAETPVVRVTACESVVGPACPSSGVAIALLPVNQEGVLRLYDGALLPQAQGFSLLALQGEEL